MGLTSATTTTALLPGASETLTVSVPAASSAKSYYATVDPADVVPECVSSNNTGAISGVACVQIK